MDAQILEKVGKVAGPIGIAIAVPVVIFFGILRFKVIEGLGLEPREAAGLLTGLVIATTGLALIGGIAWALANAAKPAGHIRGGPLALLALLALLVVGAAIAAVPLTSEPPVPKVPATNAEVPTPTPTPAPAPPQPQPQPPQPAPPPASPKPDRMPVNYLVCIGEKPGNCPSNAVHLPCGSDAGDWAKRNCSSAPRPKITKLRDLPGNRCGYLTVQVSCYAPD